MQQRLQRIDTDDGVPTSTSAENLSVRTMTEDELGLCFCWLKLDEEDGGVRWWTKAHRIMASFEEPENDGALLGLFVEGGPPLPVLLTLTYHPNPALRIIIALRSHQIFDFTAISSHALTRVQWQALPTL